MGEHRIKTYEELQKIWIREYTTAGRLDLLFIKKAWRCIDGIAVLMSPDATDYMMQNMYKISREDYSLWNKDDKKYFEWQFDL